MTMMREYIVIDIETTGLSPKTDCMIEVAGIHVKNGKIISEFSELIKPEESISSFITNLTGISNQMVKGARPEYEVLSDYYDFLGTLPLVGYNIRFDLSFLSKAFFQYYGTELDNPYLDVLPIARKKLKGKMQSYKLQNVSNYLGVSYEGAHRALRDCYITNECYKLLEK